MASPITTSLWTLCDLERSKSKSLRFQSLIYRKGAELGRMLLLSHQQETIYGESNDTITFDLERIERSSQGQSDFKPLYLVKELS